MVSPQRTEHILYGNSTGGGHPYPGKPGKSVFPQTWSQSKTMHNIPGIVTDPKLRWSLNRTVKGVQTYSVTGMRDGVMVKIITDGRDIITAFPSR